MDKRLPTKLGVNHPDHNPNKAKEYWVNYCEKAYAKRYKLYKNIDGGNTAWGLSDLSGGISINNKKLKWFVSINLLTFYTQNIRKYMK